MPHEPESEADVIARRLEETRDRVAAAATRSGRPVDDVTLVAVSKTWPAETVRLAAEAGQRVFGESRVQECLSKIPVLPGSLQWHFIGHLQTNKVRKVLPLVAAVHSIDSRDLAGAVDRIAGELGLFPEVYLQVNVAGEGAKFGFSPDEIRIELEGLLALERLQIAGLMTIPPFTADPEDSRRWFGGLRELRDELESRGGIPLPGLSMGMSGDFEVAIEEGATIVRVGTGIFGSRRGAAARATNEAGGDA